MDDHALSSSCPPRPSQPAWRGAGLPLGRILGTPVRLSVTWLLLAALVTVLFGQALASRRPELPAAVAYGVGLGFVLCLVGSVLLHELGHALTSRRMGIGVRGITLQALGGYTEMEHEPPRPSVEIAVSLAGPLVSLLVASCCALVGFLMPPGALAREIALLLAFGNAVVAGYNALPGLPLDGGRALYAVVWALTGDRRRGRRVAGWAGRAVAVVSVLVAVQAYLTAWTDWLGLVLVLVVAVTIWTGAGQAVRAAAMAERFDRFDVRRLVRPIVAVSPGTPLDEAYRQAQRYGPPEPVLTVADEYGQVTGVLHALAAAAVPEERRPWIAVADLTRTVDPSHVLSIELRGVDLLRAVSHDPGADWLVVDGDDVVGVLRGAEFTMLLESDGLVPRKGTP